MASLILRGGTVVDGTGAPRYAADVVVEDGRISAITSPGGSTARPAPCWT